MHAIRRKLGIRSLVDLQLLQRPTSTLQPTTPRPTSFRTSAIPETAIYRLAHHTMAANTGSEDPIVKSLQEYTT